MGGSVRAPGNPRFSVKRLPIERRPSAPFRDAISVDSANKLIDTLTIIRLAIGA